MAEKTSSFPSADFYNTVLVNDAQNYKNPLSVTVKALSGSGTDNNAITVEAYYGGTEDDLADEQSIPYGWQNEISVPFTQLDRGESYFFQLRNETPTGPAHIAGGTVLYDD